jgi:hypothetical protein
MKNSEMMIMVMILLIVVMIVGASSLFRKTQFATERSNKASIELAIKCFWPLQKMLGLIEIGRVHDKNQLRQQLLRVTATRHDYVRIKV